MKLFYIQKIYCLNNINSRNISNEINKWIILVFSEPQELPKVHSIRLLILWDPSSWHPPFQGPPQTLDLLSVGPSSWVHKMLAVVHRLVHEPLLFQAVVGGPAVSYYKCTRSIYKIWSLINVDPVLGIKNADPKPLVLCLKQSRGFGWILLGFGSDLWEQPKSDLREKKSSEICQIHIRIRPSKKADLDLTLKSIYLIS